MNLISGLESAIASYKVGVETDDNVKKYLGNIKNFIPTEKYSNQDIQDLLNYVQAQNNIKNFKPNELEVGLYVQGLCENFVDLYYDFVNIDLDTQTDIDLDTQTDKLKFDYFLYGWPKGIVTIKGTITGKFVGYRMSGGEMNIEINKGNVFGNFMTGGTINIFENYGEEVGSFLSNGEINIFKNHGKEVGSFLRGGIINVTVNKGEDLGKYKETGDIKVQNDEGFYAGYIDETGEKKSIKGEFKYYESF